MYGFSLYRVLFRIYRFMIYRNKITHIKKAIQKKVLKNVVKKSEKAIHKLF